MKSILFLVLVTCRIIICMESSQRFRRFLGGQDAEPGQFPYMVSLRYKSSGKHFCGGSIIDERYVLTSAHCVITQNRKSFYVAAGTNLVNETRKRFFIKRMATHVHFNTTIFKDDIALLFLKKKIKFSKYIQKIPLDHSEPPVNVNMTIIGWGVKRRSSDESSFKLQYYSNLRSMSLRYCRNKMYKTSEVNVTYVVTKRHICTYNKPYLGFCKGDSGGPLVYNDKQVGIVSWSISNRKDCAFGFPDVYIKVASYINWIRNTKHKLMLKASPSHHN